MNAKEKQKDPGTPRSFFTFAFTFNFKHYPTTSGRFSIPSVSTIGPSSPISTSCS